MNIDISARINQSLKYYMEKEISGAELSKAIKENTEAVEGLSKSQIRTFNYYVSFFEKEGEQLYLPSNKYLKEEATELGEFLEGLEKD